MPNDRDDFYVGYLPTPMRHRRFTRAMFIAVLAVAAGVGAGLAWRMDNPGEGVWQSETSTVTGTLRLDPVAFLETADGPVLLVEIGKFGPRDLTSFGEGVAVAVQGTLLERNGRRMIELADGDNAVTVSDNSAASTASKTQSSTVTIDGEIIDSKCFLGAMKPGAGRTHAACARLCIRGGIPAAIVGNADDQSIWAVLDPGEAQIISETLLNAVGEPVRLRGELSTSAGLSIVRNARLLTDE